MKEKDITAINTRYPNELLDALRELAKQHRRSLNGEIIWALQHYVEQQKERTHNAGK